jgi:hypothetical protein
MFTPGLGNSACLLWELAIQCGSCRRVHRNKHRVNHWGDGVPIDFIRGGHLYDPDWMSGSKREPSHSKIRKSLMLPGSGGDKNILTDDFLLRLDFQRNAGDF